MKRNIFYGFLFLLSLNLSGQDVEFTVEYPSVVNNGQQFSVTYNVNAGGGEFSVPSFNPFYKLMGPQTSYSSSTQIINGRMSTQTSYSYVYYLQATKEGTYVIPPAVFKLKGKEYRTDSMRIEVVAGNASSASSSSKRQGRAAASSPTDNEGVETSSGDLFVTVTLDRKEVYIGEPVMATIKLFTRVDLSGINEIKYPSFNNFLRSDLETPPLTSLQQEDINGIIYGTGVIQRFLLYPQVSGDITIEPVQLSVLVQQKSGPSDPFFGDFFSSYQTVPKAIASKEMRLKVKPLPGIKPADFSGIVGKLDMSSSLDKDSVNVNDPVNLKITISGTGNLKIAANPQLKLSPDIEVYDPKITDQVKNGPNGATGTKTFEYLLIPRHNGDFVIPPVTYSYFNTSSGRYETLSTSEYKFHARKSNEQSSGITVFGGSKKEDVKYLGKDIRFIKSGSGKLFRWGNFITNNGAFLSAYIFALFGFIVILFLRREHTRRNSDISLVRNRKAGKVAVKRLHAASVCLKNQQTDKFYEEILKAIWGYLSDKLVIPVSVLTRTNAAAALTSKGVDDEKISKMNSILDTCEYARFAPSASGAEAENIYEEASQFIRSVENSIR
jgi:hypothetical protein